MTCAQPLLNRLNDHTTWVWHNQLVPYILYHWVWLGLYPIQVECQLIIIIIIIITTMIIITTTSISVHSVLCLTVKVSKQTEKEGTSWPVNMNP